MKKRKALLILIILSMAFSLMGAAAEGPGTSSIRDMVMTEKKPFSFRNGISWGMNPQQVSVIENIPMEQRSSTEWSVMVPTEKVQVSRFYADLVYMFYQNALRMINYEFQEERNGQTDPRSLNFQYLTGALCSVYGESREANPAVIKSWMDRIYQDYYQQEKIHDALEWTAEDGTVIFLYYFSDTSFAILYVCPSNGGGSGYDTNGL